MSGVFHVGGEAYDAFMGRYSVRLAPMFADFAEIRHGERVLDVGSGTGKLADELQRRGAAVTVAEPSPEFAASLRERFDDVHEAPAERLPFEDGTFDAALAQLVVAFMEDAPAAVAEMARVARRVAVCMWGTAEVQMFAAIHETAQAIGAPREEGARRYRTLAELRDLLAPLGEVETAELDVSAPYDDFDDFWRALARQVGPAGAWLRGLDEEQAARASVELYRRLGSPAGDFTLTGRCYAARVTRA